MDPDEVTRLVNELKLKARSEHDETLSIGRELLSFGEQRLGSCLVAKIFSTKAVNLEAFKQKMPRILQTNRHVEIGSLGSNMFFLDFKSPIDKKRALLGGPWNLFRDLIIFREPHGMQTPKDMCFEEISIWVQLYNLPMALMHREVLQKLGSQIGQVEEIDACENGLCMGRYARLRVSINITKPLKKFIRVSINPNDEEVYVILSYERLPDFCFRCGRIGHSFRECDLHCQGENGLAFGNWLRAPNPSPSHKSTSRKNDVQTGSSREEDEDSGGNILTESAKEASLIEDNLKLEGKVTQQLEGTDAISLINQEAGKDLSKVSPVSDTRTLSPHPDPEQGKGIMILPMVEKQSDLLDNAIKLTPITQKKWKRIAREPGISERSREPSIIKKPDSLMPVF